jgi:hypothetical protein
MARLRPNTIILKLDGLPRRPTTESLHVFVQEKLSLNHNNVQCFQISFSQKRVFIELASELNAELIALEENEKHALTVDGENFKIPVQVYDDSITVRLYDLAPNLPNREVKQKLSEYGTVISIASEVWGEKMPFAGIENGIRLVKIKLNKPIPSYVTIGGETTYVTHPKQVLTCRWCEQPVHFGQKCAENRATTSVNERLSFAQAMQENSTQQQQQSTQQTEQSTTTTSSSASTTSTLTTSSTESSTTEKTPTVLLTRLPQPTVTQAPVSGDFEQQHEEQEEEPIARFEFSSPVPPSQPVSHKVSTNVFDKSNKNTMNSNNARGTFSFGIGNRSPIPNLNSDAMEADTIKSARSLESASESGDEPDTNKDRKPKKPKVTKQNHLVTNQNKK